jgi:hypothetical protein
MSTNQLATQISRDEKAKVAYALNLCAVSISQIIDSKDIVVLKQERESILNNLNLQNFVKHPALLEVLKQILDTITYLEIQAGDLAFFENKEGLITHTGIILDADNIIHASGKVRIDKITQQGIYSIERNEYSHKLKIIKRII